MPWHKKIALPISLLTIAVSIFVVPEAAPAPWPLIANGLLGLAGVSLAWTFWDQLTWLAIRASRLRVRVYLKPKRFALSPTSTADDFEWLRRALPNLPPGQKEILREMLHEGVVAMREAMSRGNIDGINLAEMGVVIRVKRGLTESWFEIADKARPIIEDYFENEG